MLQSEYSPVLSVSSIGKTYKGEDLKLVHLKLNKGDQGTDLGAYNNSILFTGAHHARELTSVHMSLYLMLKFLYNYQQKDPMTLRLLENNHIFFIPMVNTDGIKQISETFARNETLSFIRKNLNNGLESCSDGTNFGVDLNRNYGFKWGYSDEGSSRNPCAEDFRGYEAFSEPETQAIRDFVEQNKDSLKLAINFHAYGNLFIHPFNFDTRENNLLNRVYPQQAVIYEEIWNETKDVISGMIKGNGQQTIQYDANGEASDWMLGEHKIISLSPELGITDEYGGNGPSDHFFIKSQRSLKEVMVKNQQWIFSTVKKLEPQVNIALLNATLIKSKSSDPSKAEVIFRVKNKGFRMLAGESRVLGITTNTNIQANLTSALVGKDDATLFKSAHTYTVKLPQIQSQETLNLTLSMDVSDDITNLTESLLTLMYLEYDLDADLKTLYLNQTDLTVLTTEDISSTESDKPQHFSSFVIVSVLTALLIILIAIRVYQHYKLNQKQQEEHQQLNKQGAIELFNYESSRVDDSKGRQAPVVVVGNTTDNSADDDVTDDEI